MKPLTNRFLLRPWLLPGVIALLLWPVAFTWGEDPEGKGEAAHGLPDPALELITISAQDMDVREILSMFSQSRGINIVSAGNVTGRISIELHEVPFDQALNAVVSAAGCQAVHRGDIYFVRRPKDEKTTEGKGDSKSSKRQALSTFPHTSRFLKPSKTLLSDTLLSDFLPTDTLMF